MTRVGGKTIWTRCEIIDEPRGVTAQAHHPDPISGYSRTQCQLVDDTVWGNDIQLYRAVEDIPEVRDKILLPEAVLACDPTQPGGQRLSVDWGRVQWPAHRHSSSRSKSRRRCVGPT
nr:hypothetical protein [Corynebacterium glutamicum]